MSGVAVLLAIAGFGYGCGEDLVDPPDPSTAATSTAASGGDASGGATGNGTGGSGGLSFVNLGGFGGNSVGEGGVGGACAGEVSAAELLPLDMYLMLDRSLSMNEETETVGVTKWEAVTQALAAFAQDSESAGLGVGIQYFPANPPCDTDGDCPGSYCYLSACNNVPTPQPCQTDGDCPGTVSGSCVPIGECGAQTCTSVGDMCGATAVLCQQLSSSVCVQPDTCPVSLYSTPAVPTAELPAAAAAFQASLTSMSPAPIPYGLTPTGPALQGAIDYSKQWVTANPTHTAIAVLVTDGVPTQCAPSGTSAVAAIASVGYFQDPSVQTFTIGVFAPDEMEGKANIQAIADAGGGQAFIVDPNADVEQQFIDALNSIRAESKECLFDIPAPEGDGELDFQKVNVELTDGDGNTTVLAYVASESQCDPNTGGWYYDTPPEDGTPTKIIVCDANCDTFSASINAKVEIRVGCKTITIPN